MFEDNRSELITTYLGSPHDIITTLCKEMSDAFERVGIALTGVHLVAMMYLVAAATRRGLEDPSPRLGAMPSFKLLLMIFTKVLTSNGDYSEAEQEHFKKEFTDLVKSLGGHEVPPESQFRKEITYVSPASKEVH